MAERVRSGGNVTTQRNLVIGASLGFVGAALIGGGLLIAGFLPPPSPGDSLRETAARYADDVGRIRAGVAVTAFGSFMLVGWYAAVAVAIRRIEGAGRMLTNAWVIAAAGSMMDFILPLLFLEAAAFRADDPSIVRGFNDLGWTCFLAAPYIFAFQAAVLAAAVLQDRRPEPILPRWFGYTSLSCGVLYLPGAFVVFVKSGPLAWNGVLAWWIPVVAFGVWLVAASILLIRARAQLES